MTANSDGPAGRNVCGIARRDAMQDNLALIAQKEASQVLEDASSGAREYIRSYLA